MLAAKVGLSFVFRPNQPITAKGGIKMKQRIFVLLLALMLSYFQMLPK